MRNLSARLICRQLPNDDHVSRLVYYETTTDVKVALAREKAIKAWRREKKLELIEAANPTWQDLSASWDESETDLS